MKNIDKKSIVKRFSSNEKLKYIAEDFGITSSRIGQIIRECISKEEIKYIKKTNSLKNLQKRKLKYFERYHTDTQHKEEIKKKNLIYYHNKKICNKN